MSLTKSLAAALATAFFFISTLFVSPCLAETENYDINDSSPEAIVIDSLILRPAGLVATVLGTGAYVVALPFSLIQGNTGETADILIGTPAHYTFTRELGNIEKDL